MKAHWFALTVRPQHEKTAARALRLKGLEEFLPLYRCRRRWSDRTKELEVPLFPGYVFCRFRSERRAYVLATPAITTIVAYGRAPAPVADAEIAAIETMVSSGLPVEPWPFLQVGQRVRVADGPLRELTGILVRARDRWRVVVNVELLQRSVAVELDRHLLAPERGSLPKEGQSSLSRLRG